MAHSPITPVILTGGSGTRLWPLSRKARPKQFLPLAGERTLLEDTIARAAGDRFAPPLLVGGAAQAETLRALAGEGARLMLEPMARNTAPAIALAALALDPDALMLVMPSDHVIADVPAFHAAIEKGAALAADDWLVTFGITPDGPETGYGYIRQGGAIGDAGYEVERFVEKPDRETAQGFLAEGGYYWNGGIFLFTARAYLAGLDVHAPEVAASARAAMAGMVDSGSITPDAAAFGSAPSISIDYAVMEKADRVAVVTVSMGWSDLGSWDALHELLEKDEAGNAQSGDSLTIDSANTLIRSDGPLVAAVGVSDLIIVTTGDAVLVMPRGESERVKEVVDALKFDGDPDDLL